MSITSAMVNYNPKAADPFDAEIEAFEHKLNDAVTRANRDPQDDSGSLRDKMLSLRNIFGSRHLCSILDVEDSVDMDAAIESTISEFRYGSLAISQVASQRKAKKAIRTTFSLARDFGISSSNSLREVVTCLVLCCMWASESAQAPGSKLATEAKKARYLEYLRKLEKTNDFRTKTAERMLDMTPEMCDAILRYLAEVSLPSALEFHAVCQTDTLSNRFTIPGRDPGHSTLVAIRTQLLQGLAAIELVKPPAGRTRAGNSYTGEGLRERPYISLDTEVQTHLGAAMEEAIIKATGIIHTAQFPNSSSPERLPYPLHLATIHKQHIHRLHLTVVLSFSIRSTYPTSLFQAQAGVPTLLTLLPNLKNIKVDIVEEPSDEVWHPGQPGIVRAPYFARGYSQQLTTITQELEKLVTSLRQLEVAGQRSLCYYGEKDIPNGYDPTLSTKDRFKINVKDMKDDEVADTLVDEPGRELIV